MTEETPKPDLRILSEGNLEYKITFIVDPDATRLKDVQIEFKDTLTDRLVASMMLRGMIKEFIAENKNRFSMKDKMSYGKAVIGIEKIIKILEPAVLKEQAEAVKENTDSAS